MKTTLLVLAFFFGRAALAQDVTMDAAEIMQRARQAMPAFRYQVRGTIRQESSHLERPFVVRHLDGVIEWLFSKPFISIRVSQEDGKISVHSTMDGHWAALSPERYVEQIDGTHASYEDLAMGFMNWENGTLLGEDRPGSSQSSWVVRLTPPDDRGTYSAVDIWVQQQTGLVVKAELWSRHGTLAKRLLLRSISSTDWGHFPKDMRIDAFDENGEEWLGRNYVTFEKPAPLGGAVPPQTSSTTTSAQAPASTWTTGPRHGVVGGAVRYTGKRNDLGATAPSPIASKRSENGLDVSVSAPTNSTPIHSSSRSTHSRTEVQTPADAGMIDQLLSLLRQQSNLLIAIIGIFILLLVAAAYLVGWKRGHHSGY